MMNDLLLDDAYNLSISNGDFLVGDGSAQSVELILQSFQGEWKNAPIVGCNILDAKNGLIDRYLNRNIRIQLEADGFELEKLNIRPEGIEVKGNYKP